jgi:squalene-hopene/tetraprenyl-beta-curcumene cyclase
MLSSGTSVELDRVLALATEHCVATQRGNGSWSADPDPRVTETALASFVLSRSTSGPARDAARAGRKWLRAAAPQKHHPVAEAIESSLRSMVLSGSAACDLAATAGREWSARARLLRIVGLRADRDEGDGVSGAFRAEVERDCEEASTARLKPWSHVELLAGCALLSRRFAEYDKAREYVLAVAGHQAPDGSFYGNPISTVLAFAAFDAVVPGGEPWLRALRWLLDSQHRDGTWRFCASDVWDTTLTMRAFQGLPLFDTRCWHGAVEFLLGVQNDDGGWPFKSSVESDNDTTAAAVIALASAGMSDPVRRALTYLSERQTGDGLWRTWQFRDDPPVEDVVAHVVTALRSHSDSHHVPLAAAQRWLAERRSDRGRWTASWYRGLPYATSEVSQALSDRPLVETAAKELAEVQNADGGWPAEPGEASTPSNTGLALATMLRGGVRDRRMWQGAVDYLLLSHRGDGTWPGQPEMYGPRPLLTHFPTHTQAFAVLGLRAARAYFTPAG